MPLLLHSEKVTQIFVEKFLAYNNLMIKLFDNDFNIDSINHIYGLVNVPEDKYYHGLTSFTVSNVFQIKKLLSNQLNPIFIAISVNLLIEAQKKGKIQENSDG